MGRRLVRDRALDNWVVPGAEHQVRPVRDDWEHRALLRSKLLEECGEVVLSENPAEVLKELADLLSVMQAFAQANDIHWGEVLTKQAVRDSQSGGFTHGMVWETSR